MGIKREFLFWQLPVKAPLEQLNSSPDRLNSAEASLRAWPISAQKVLPGIEVLHATWKKCNASVACNAISTQVHPPWAVLTPSITIHIHYIKGESDDSRPLGHTICLGNR